MRSLKISEKLFVGQRDAEKGIGSSRTLEPAVALARIASISHILEQSPIGFSEMLKVGKFQSELLKQAVVMIIDRSCEMTLQTQNFL